MWRSVAKSSLRNILSQIFLEEGNHCLNSEDAMYFLFQLKQFLDKEQMEGEQNRGGNTSSFTGSAILNADDGHDDKDSYSLGGISHFGYTTKRTYKMKRKYYYTTGDLGEFVVGRYTFPIIPLPLNISSLGLRGELIGTSILSFKDSVLAHRQEGKKKIYWLQDRIQSDEEGRYWLWLIPNQSHILIDSTTLISEFSDGTALQRFDLGKHGEKISGK
jgi:hypothetical protein